MTLQVEFYGAAGEVTGSCHLVQIGDVRILLDCGLIQGSAKDEDRNREPFPFDHGRAGEHRESRYEAESGEWKASTAMHKYLSIGSTPTDVIPAKAGIQGISYLQASRHGFRLKTCRNDEVFRILLLIDIHALLD